MGLTIGDAKVSIRDALAHQIAVMRLILSSMVEERRAIVVGSEEQLLTILEERLPLVTLFERRSGSLSAFLGISSSGYRNLLEQLQQALSEEEVDLLLLCTQAETLFNEIEVCNSANGHLMKQGQLPELLLEPQLKRAAVALAVIDKKL